MTVDVATAVDQFDSLFTAKLQAWFASGQAGADIVQDRYYGGRINSKRCLTVERALIAYIMKLPPPKRMGGDDSPLRVCEIGMGYGQLSMALASLGLKTMGFEMADTRHTGAVYLREALEPYYPGLFQRFLPIKNVYPDDVRLCSFDPDLVVATNTANSHWNEWCLVFGHGAALRSRPGIIDVSVWGRMRNTKEEQAELVKSICDCGFAAQPVPNTTYWHFTLTEAARQRDTLR